MKKKKQSALFSNFFHSYLNETKQINIQFLSNVHISCKQYNLDILERPEQQ